MEPQDRERFIGLRQDIEGLLVKFLQTQNVRFQMFAEEWRKLNFSFIHYGIEKGIEKKEVTQEAFRITTEYLLPPYEMQRRVGALYILYGLYMTQPHKPKFKIRISLDQWKNVILLIETLKVQGHLDTIYIFHKLLTGRAFTFTARPNRMVFHISYMEGKPEQNPTERWLDRHRHSLMTECFDDATLEMHHDLHEQYQQMKVNLGLHDHTSLMVVRESVTEYIAKRFEKLEADFETARAQKRASDSDDPVDKDQSSNVAEIKARSYSTIAKVSKSRRHRQQAAEPSPATDGHKDQSNPKIYDAEFSESDNDLDDVTWTPHSAKKDKKSSKNKKAPKQKMTKDLDGLLSQINKKISQTAKDQSLEDEEDDDSEAELTGDLAILQEDIREQYSERDMTTPMQKAKKPKGRKDSKRSPAKEWSTTLVTPQKQQRGSFNASPSSTKRARPGSSNKRNTSSSPNKTSQPAKKAKLQDSETPEEVVVVREGAQTCKKDEKSSTGSPKKKWKKTAQDVPDDTAGPSSPTTPQTLQPVTADETSKRLRSNQPQIKGRITRNRNVKMRGGGVGARTRGARNNVSK